MYEIHTTVKRPPREGEVEALPERLGVRAVCSLPKTEAGKSEAVGGVGWILEQRGIFEPGGGTESALAPVAGGSWALAALHRALGGALWPRPLAAQEEGDDNVEHVDTTECVWYGTWGWCGTTAVRVCALGYDWDETGTSCVPTFVGEGTESTGNPGSGSTPGGSNSGYQSGGNGETGTRTVEFALSCPVVPRGSDGTCSVSASGEDLGTLEFAWSSTAAGTVDATLGKSSWSGAAVSDVTVTVTISDPAGAIAGATESAVAAVTPRTWTFTPPAPASTSSGYGGANWGPGKWGQHDSGSTTVSGVLAGTGPWEGLYTGDAAPVHNGDNGITLHSDFDGQGSAYSGANGVACFAATSSAASANVVAVNAACGTSSQLSSWEGMALAHERDHAKSGDKCLQSATTANKIRELEAIMGTKVDDVRDALHDDWNDFWTTIVIPAFEGKLLTPTSPVFWEYRFKGSWDRHAIMGGQEGGTTNCR